ncbi:hypothetical protein [Actinomycetospora sp. TBRC 11914]|uniref:hypothetical protein n=1 Tax=Actinomycetospora sp. TBRC 11914 TaxID=2729387 RepID=UPI00145CC1FB|nr:hypothetical protein [Actinomycetospora sp. TBRC 11914]NMO88387.1 hypothetical protein [Actinomycetospora sp. TBRC 11914]
MTPTPAPRRGTRPRTPLLGVLLVLLLAVACSTSPPPPGNGASGDDARPAANGHLALKPVGSFLLDDAQAAAMVQQSSWEPRPENTTPNHTVPPPDFRPREYGGMANGDYVFNRITGNYTGTTDEIFQWAAAKWGLPDELVRAEASVESQWYQGHKDASGNPINQEGYGDFGDCGGSPPPSPFGPQGPAAFGVMQVKWCAVNDMSQGGYGGWPWTENSTAYSVDTYAAVLRGCYEGWEPWLGPNYHAGDLWGCVGRWYTGTWYSPTAQNYIARVQHAMQTKPWLTW